MPTGSYYYPVEAVQRMQQMSEAPLASIIILFMDGSPWIQACLESVRRNRPVSIPHELIVVANGVADNVELPLTESNDLRVLRSNVNLGFGGGCNWASRYARGRYLVFLNDDAAVEPGWLKALIEVAEKDQTVAAIGSLLLGPDGLIEEAGRVLWREGVSDGIASGLSPTKVTLPSTREVDACSACSLLVRRSAWDAVGGFDERYFPAYYEDVDLCLELRARGLAIACASGSRVRHQRSASTSMLWRRFLGLRNHRIFVDKWTAMLSGFDPRPRDQPSLAEIERAALTTGERRRAIYHGSGMQSSGDGGAMNSPQSTDPVTLLERENAHLRQELRLKEEYIAHIEATTPQLERGLQRVLADEARRARRRERVRSIPLLGGVAAWFNHKVHAPHRPEP